MERSLSSLLCECGHCLQFTCYVNAATACYSLNRLNRRRVGTSCRCRVGEGKGQVRRVGIKCPLRRQGAECAVPFRMHGNTESAPSIGKTLESRAPFRMHVNTTMCTFSRQDNTRLRPLQDALSIEYSRYRVWGTLRGGGGVPFKNEAR